MLEAHEQGLTDDEIKGKFAITDSRTLKRHLKLAEQEREASLVKTEILKETLAKHLDAIYRLIQQFRDTLCIPPIGEVYKETTLPTLDIERNPLFACLREHLPFATLWRNYSIWQKEGKEYLQSCNNLIAEIEAEASGWQGVKRFTSSFVRPVLERLSNKARGQEPEVHRFEAYPYREQQEERISYFEKLVVDGKAVLEASNALALSKLYQELSDKVLAGEAVTNLIALFNGLKALEPKIQQSLEEILLRHDHIMYACKFCPGLPR